MSNPSETNICAICHESLNENIYVLPECIHTYHTNCIMHWFRAGHNNCPLCNNTGINSPSNQSQHPCWCSRKKILENYKFLRKYSRKKNASILLKQKVEKIKKKEKKINNKIQEIKIFLKNIPQGKTVKEICKELQNKNKKVALLRRQLRQAKFDLGASESIIPIIIATKIDIFSDKE